MQLSCLWLVISQQRREEFSLRLWKSIVSPIRRVMFVVGYYNATIIAQSGFFVELCVLCVHCRRTDFDKYSLRAYFRSAPSLIIHHRSSTHLPPRATLRMKSPGPAATSSIFRRVTNNNGGPTILCFHFKSKFDLILVFLSSFISS